MGKLGRRHCMKQREKEELYLENDKMKKGEGWRWIKEGNMRVRH